MATSTEQRLERLLRASEAAGKVVVEAVIDREGIRLRFAERPAEPDTMSLDLKDWRR